MNNRHEITAKQASMCTERVIRQLVNREFTREVTERGARTVQAADSAIVEMKLIHSAIVALKSLRSHYRKDHNYA